MGTGRARVAASILDSDLGSLAHVVRRLEKAGADRIHLDVMDGHFVPNLTFGPRTIKALRPRTELPFDAHLMISEPGRYLDEYIDAGCDSITIHVEIAEPIEPTLERIRQAGLAPGVSLKPATPLRTLERYRKLIDIIMVMTVEPGFGGQQFMREPARKILRARSLFSERPMSGEIHVDGGVNRETAEYVGGLGADILVVGSALFEKGHDMRREIRLVKALADEGYAFQLNAGKPPVPRDEWRSIASLPRHIGSQLRSIIEAEGIPVIMLRADGRINPDGVRDYELLVPRSVEAVARERFAAQRRRAEAEADGWRSAFEGTQGDHAIRRADPT